MISERAKILIMGVLLAGLVFAYFYLYLYPNSARPQPDNPDVRRPPAVDLAAFRLDPSILAQIKDDTKANRAYLESEPWAHLISKSYNIGPAAASALRVSEQMADIRTLRQNPGHHRGEFIWFKGKLAEFQLEDMEHPITRAKAYKGRLVTGEGASVLFYVSTPLPDGIEVDKDWVRVDGFFMKIRDEYILPNTSKDVLDAPLLIGPEVAKAYPDWEAVEKLDQAVLRRVKNARWDKDKGEWIDADDMYAMLDKSEDVPLWHLSSYAIRDYERKKETPERNPIVFEAKDQYTKFKHGDFPQGEPVRLRGQFITAGVFPARTNPVGIKYWSEVWIRIPRLGSKLIPIWIPRDIGEWTRGTSVDIDAFFFKNYGYPVMEGPDRHTPLFVAGGLDPFVLTTNPAAKWIGLGFTLFVALLAFVFFRMNRRARLESDDYKRRLIERRRGRRSPKQGTLQTP